MSDMSHNHQKKIAVINDMSGFGRCSIAVELPVISAMKVQCCPLPTSIFSNHTGFESFFFDDYTDKMEDYMQEWVKLGLQFNGICTGFLGSARQIRIVEHFLSLFQTKDNITIIDPVMGDYGKMYPTYTQETCEEMKKLVTHADILTPNLTEGCILSGMAYHESWTKKELTHMAELLAEKGPEKIVITGIKTEKAGMSRSGTGDIFSAIIAADAVNGVDFHDSVKKASAFIKKCILKSMEMDIPLTDGVCFEELLTTLK